MSLAWWTPWTREQIRKERTSNLIARLASMVSMGYGTGFGEASMIAEEIDSRVPASPVRVEKKL